MNDGVKYGANANADPIRVRHVDLERSGDSAYKSSCPVCKDGILLIYRTGPAFNLSAIDRCVRCAQVFVYEDAQIGGEAVVMPPDLMEGLRRGVR